MLRCPARRRVLIAKFRRVAMFSGPRSVRMRLVSSEGDALDEVEPVLDAPL